MDYDDFLNVLFIRERLQRLVAELGTRFGEVPPELREALSEADQNFRLGTHEEVPPLVARDGWWWSRVPHNLTPEFARVLSARMRHPS